MLPATNYNHRVNLSSQVTALEKEVRTLSTDDVHCASGQILTAHLELVPTLQHARAAVAATVGLPLQAPFAADDVVLQTGDVFLHLGVGLQRLGSSTHPPRSNNQWVLVQAGTRYGRSLFVYTMSQWTQVASGLCLDHLFDQTTTLASENLPSEAVSLVGNNNNPPRLRVRFLVGQGNVHVSECDQGTGVQISQTEITVLRSLDVLTTTGQLVVDPNFHTELANGLAINAPMLVYRAPGGGVAPHEGTVVFGLSSLPESVAEGMQLEMNVLSETAQTQPRTWELHCLMQTGTPWTSTMVVEALAANVPTRILLPMAPLGAEHLAAGVGFLRITLSGTSPLPGRLALLGLRLLWR